MGLVATDSGPIVLDTDVTSFLFRQNRNARYYQERLEGRQGIISFQTLEELWCWAHIRGWGNNRKVQLSAHVDQYEVIWPGTELVEMCALLRSARQKAGRRLNAADAWIAATAIMLDCPLASHDRDFSGIPGLQLIRNPSP